MWDKPGTERRSCNILAVYFAIMWAGSKHRVYFIQLSHVTFILENCLPRKEDVRQYLNSIFIEKCNKTSYKN
jgi:hypothetical protein